MRLIEFETVDNYEYEFTIFIKPKHIESISAVTNINRIGIGLVSGNPVEVTHSLKEVMEKSGAAADFTGNTSTSNLTTD